MIKKVLLTLVLLIFISGIVSASLSDTIIRGKAPESREIDNSSASLSDNYPGVVKILVYADYSYDLPEVLQIDTKPYTDKIAAGANPDMKSDIKISVDLSKNMYDNWYNSKSKDIQVPFSFGTGFFITPDGYLLTNAHLVKPNQELFEEWTRGYILRTIEREINIQNVNNNYTNYSEYLVDAALYNFLRENLRFRLDNFRVRVLLNGNEYEPQIISYESNKDFSQAETLDWALLKLNISQNVSYLRLGDSSKINSSDSIKIIGYPSYSGINLVKKSNYPIFESYVFPTKSSGYIAYLYPYQFDSFTMTDIALSEGQSGSPVLDKNNSVIGIATYNFPSYFGGNRDYSQKINSIVSKLPPAVKFPYGPAVPLPVKTKKPNHSNALMIVIILLLLAAIAFGVYYFKFHRRVSDKIIIITRPKPSIFSSNSSYPTSQDVLGKIRTYS